MSPEFESRRQRRITENIQAVQSAALPLPPVEDRVSQLSRPIPIDLGPQAVVPQAVVPQAVAPVSAPAQSLSRRELRQQQFGSSALSLDGVSAAPALATNASAAPTSAAIPEPTPSRRDLRNQLRQAPEPAQTGAASAPPQAVAYAPAQPLANQVQLPQASVPQTPLAQAPLAQAPQTQRPAAQTQGYAGSQAQAVTPQIAPAPIPPAPVSPGFATPAPGSYSQPSAPASLPAYSTSLDRATALPRQAMPQDSAVRPPVAEVLYAPTTDVQPNSEPSNGPMFETSSGFSRDTTTNSIVLPSIPNPLAGSLLTESGVTLKTGSIELPNLNAGTGSIALPAAAQIADEALRLDSSTTFVTSISPIAAKDLIKRHPKMGFSPVKSKGTQGQLFYGLTTSFLMLTVGGLLVVAWMYGFIK